MIDWDHNVVDYDLEKFPWYERILSVIQEVKPQCDSIGRLHEYFDRTEVVPLRKKIERFVRTKEFSGWVDDYFYHIIDDREYLIQATPTLNVVLPDQQRQGSLLTFHTGHLTAYSEGMHTIWTPVSEAFGSNSMQVVSREDSKYLTEVFLDHKLSMADMQYLCQKYSYPVEIKQGQAWLFDQDHWHGNINNTTGVTRIGLDIRAMDRKRIMVIVNQAAIFVFQALQLKHRRWTQTGVGSFSMTQLEIIWVQCLSISQEIL